MSQASSTASPRITVHYFQRRRGPGHFSLEKVFAEIGRALPCDVDAKVLECPWASRGVIRRLLNIIWARVHAGPINHVTGDVHYLCLGLPKARTILTVHDCASLHRTHGLRRSLLRLLWFDLPLRRAAIVTAVSEFTRKELLSHTNCDPKQIRVIHAPVAGTFRPHPKPFNGAAPNVLLIGSAPNKNLERTIEALRRLPCTITVVGRLSEPQRALLVATGLRYEQHDEVTEDELVRLYERCDLLVFASLYEGFGLPIVEAQAVGRPVVTSNRCSMPEVAGAGACLVDPESADSIGQALRRLIDDAVYRENLVQDGFTNVLRFSAPRLADEHAALYRRLAVTNFGGPDR